MIRLFSMKLPATLLSALLLMHGHVVHSATKLTAAHDATELPPPVNRPVKYFGDIHPVLVQHCVGCHGPDKQKGGLRLDSLDAALAGGSSYGPAIVPGKSAESPMILFMAHLEPDMEMPPKEDKLPEETIAVLRAWIDQGAKWPARAAGGDAAGRPALGNQELIGQKAATHWAFQPVAKADAASLAEGPAIIDAIVAVKLKAKGLQPSPQADARTLLKRMHFDLTGLPPTIEELNAFTTAFAKDADAALAAKVDELLASPHFGERWGRYWLDLARYADTQDFFPQPDLRYPFAWTFRDYVVGALNADKPYDRFIQEQLSADQMGLKDNDPNLAALGYLTVGPRFLRRNDEVINDRIDMVTRGLMGLTAACARCHDHKYDPIPTADFYALYGVFASTDDLVDLPEIAMATGKVTPKARAEYEAAKGKATKGLTDFLQQQKNKALADVMKKPEIYFDALCQMQVKKTANVIKLMNGGKMLETALTPLGRQWDTMRGTQAQRENPVTGPLATVAASTPDHKAVLLAEMISSGFLPGKKVAVNLAVLAALRAEKPNDEEALVRLYGKLVAQAQNGDLKPVIASLSSKDGLLDFSLKDVEEVVRGQGTERKTLDKLQTAVGEVESTHPGAPARAMAVKDKAKPVIPVIFIRGDSARKGDKVERHFLQLLDPQKTPFPADSSGRRELAQRITSADNPLTPRVWANHVWRHLLGRPLAKTPGDFGLQAEPPSHPELLDWLASALVQRGWSTKKLVRDIMLSATYQQSSADLPAAAAMDAENQLLWRANRRRMDFESMRDAMLSTSGQLDPALGGRSVNLSAEPFSGKRTIYGFVDRVNLDPLFTTFDFPSPDIASTERAQTLVPQQALFALNDGFIVSQARSLAKKVREAAGGGGDASGAIDWMYRRVFQRHPTDQEAQMGKAFLKETEGLHPPTIPGSWQYGMGSADPAVQRSKAFQSLPYFDPQAKRYQGGRVFPHPQTSFASLTASGGHPGPSIDKATIRRWIAPYSGDFAINGEVSVGNKGTGDGVRARVISSKSGLLGEWIADGAPAKTELTKLTLKAGEILDFTVDCRDNMNADGFRWTPAIRLLVRAEIAPKKTQTVWESQADFKAPPPPKLQPLEQMAHALLMTNEFLFVD